MVGSQTSLALSNLRAVVIVIVLAFHSCLAYLASAPSATTAFDQPPYTWQAFPIVDSQRWLGFDIFCAWQDVSLMALMFFLSGLFAQASLTRKGAWGYLSDRFWRIGVPFLLAVLFLSPLALFPAYIIRATRPTLAGFFHDWFSLPMWPSGPEWFLGELLVITFLAVALFVAAPRLVHHLDRFAAWACERQLRLFGVLAAASVVAYVPLAMGFSPWSWSALGPFSFQVSRPFLYLVYFLAAFGIGSRALDGGLLACDGPLARNWARWLAAALVTFGLWAGCTGLTQPDWAQAPVLFRLGASVAFAFACPAGGLFLVAICLRFLRRRGRLLDSFSANAYGMYLVHYVFVVWLQYALLASGLPLFAKVALVFAGTLLLSWASCAAFSRLAGASYGLGRSRAVAPVHR